MASHPAEFTETRLTITKRPTLPEEASESTLSGFLEKLSQNRLGFQVWQRRWFEVHGTSLLYFHSKPPMCATPRPDGAIHLSNIVSVVSGPNNEIVLTSRSGRIIHLRISAEDFGASAAVGEARAAEAHTAWMKVLTAISEDLTTEDNGEESSKHSAASTQSGGIQMTKGSNHSPYTKRGSGKADPEVTLTTVHDMTSDAGGTGLADVENPLAAQRAAPSRKAAQDQTTRSQKEHDDLPPTVHAFLVLLGLTPPRLGLAPRLGTHVMWAMRALIVGSILTAAVLEVVEVVGRGNLAQACGSLSFRQFGVASVSSNSDESTNVKSGEARCDAQLLLSIPTIVNILGSALIYLWMVARINEKSLLPTHRHRLNGYLSRVAWRMFVSWFVVTALAAALSQLPDCPQYDTLREQLRGLVHTLIIGPVYYGFVFIYYSETYRLRCIAEDFSSLLQNSDDDCADDADNNAETPRGAADNAGGRWSSRLTSRVRSLHLSATYARGGGDRQKSDREGTVGHWGPYHDAFQHCHGEFEAVQKLIGPVVSFYFAQTIIWMCSGIYHSYVAGTLAEGTLYSVMVFGSIIPILFVFYAMARVNQAGEDLVKDVAAALARSSINASCDPADLGGVKLLLVVQSLPCSLTSLGRRVESGDLVYVIALVLVSQLIGALNVDSNVKSS